MDDRILEHYLEEFQTGMDIDPSETEILFDALISSKNQLLLTRLMLAWEDKGTTEDELFSFAKLMRDRMKRISFRAGTCVDIVGTGGSSAKIFNVSTAAAFVIAGAGLAVAKHGNRAATSRSGSADALNALGIEFDIDPSVSERYLNDFGICFMFAPRYHSLSPTLARARRAVGHPTIFNSLGPLCNPASVTHQVVGVWDKHLIEITAKALRRLGAGRSWVVYGENGLDEIALAGTTLVAEVGSESETVRELSAADFGIGAVNNDLPSKCSPEESAKTIRAILANEMKDRDAEKLVLINAAAAIFVAGRAASLSDAYELAKNSVRSGAGLEKLAVLAGAKVI